MDVSRIRFGGSAASNRVPEPQSLAADYDAALARDRDAMMLLPSHELSRLRREWRELQEIAATDPRDAVSSAHALAHEVTTRIWQQFEQERARLERQWHSGEVSAEDLRVALTRYRAFFERLLAA